MCIVIEPFIKVIFGSCHDSLAQIFICQNVVSLLVYEFTLLVENVIVVNQILTDLKVAFLDLLLSLFNALCEPWMINWFAWLHTDSSHEVLHSITAEKTHEVIVHRDKEFRSSRVTLSSTSASELVVDTSRFVAF